MSTPTRADLNCFADEIAIDFPSIGHLVARVRASLLSDDETERSQTLKTVVWLSGREAFLGAVVPVAVLLRGTCRGCGGRGETWAERCPDCDGSGDQLVRHRLNVTVPPRVADGSRFHFRVRGQHEAAVHVVLRVSVA